MKRFVFWQHSKSLHQAGLMRELSSMEDVEVTLISFEAVPERRLAMGWNSHLDYGETRVIELDGQLPSQQIAQAFDPKSIHIISGLGRDSFSRRAIKIASRSPLPVIGFYLEPWQLRRNSLKEGLLYLIYRRVIRRLSGLHPFFLSTGLEGERQLSRLGVNPQEIYPFGYFLDRPTELLSGSAESNEKVRILFVGELASHKNVLSLVRTYVNSGVGLDLTIVGDGPLKDDLKRIISSTDSESYYYSVLDNSDVLQLMRESDYLILPSLYDGWGAVCSEALLVGTPVLVSSSAGASRVVDSDDQGFVFRPDQNGLLAALDFARRSGVVVPDRRERLANWAAQSISSFAGARYLADIVSYRNGSRSRPRPPWSKVSKQA